MKKKSQIAGVIALCVITFLVLSGLTLRLAYLQLVKGEEYSASAQRISKRSYTVAAARGQLYDRNGIPYDEDTFPEFDHDHDHDHE